MKFRTVIAAFLMSVAGCGSVTPPSQMLELKKDVTWIDSDATRRSIFLIKGENGKPPVIVAAEPPPDAAMATAATLTGKLTYQGLNAETSASLTQSITELGQKSEAVMVLREGLYRIQQMVTDGQMAQSDATALFGKVLDAATKVAAATENDSQTNLVKAQNNQKALDLLPDSEKKSLSVQKLQELLNR